MTSLVAVIPVANLAAANAALEAQGFGPGNFSVPCYTGAGVTHAALHCWNNPAFFAAVQALPNVAVDIGTGDDKVRTQALIEAQGATWGSKSPWLPDTGTVTAGEMYRYPETNGEYSLWSIIQTFNRSTFNAPPETYPALCRRVRNPYATEPWRQPIDQYDAYKLVNAFTGEPDKCTHNGKTWEVTQADGAGNNVWEPGVFGWTEV